MDGKFGSALFRSSCSLRCSEGPRFPLIFFTSTIDIFYSYIFCFFFQVFFQLQLFDLLPTFYLLRTFFFTWNLFFHFKPFLLPTFFYFELVFSAVFLHFQHFSLLLTFFLLPNYFFSRVFSLLTFFLLPTFFLAYRYGWHVLCGFVARYYRVEVVRWSKEDDQASNQ